jgi:hypothetical protein
VIPDEIFHFPLRITVAAMKLFGFADDTSQKRTAASDWTTEATLSAAPAIA